jgi:hypothetical protein
LTGRAPRRTQSVQADARARYALAREGQAVSGRHGAIRVASWRRRLLAGTIDALVVLGPIAALIAAMVKSSSLRRSGSRTLSGLGRKSGLSAQSVTDAITSHERELAAAGLAFGVLSRNWRSPGARIAGIRRADARTGGAVSVRSAIVAGGVKRGWEAGAKRLLGPAQERSKSQLEANRRMLEAELEELERRYVSDPEGLERERAALVARRGTNPFPSCLLAAAGPLSLLLTARLSPRRQNIAELIAGIVVVEDR